MEEEAVSEKQALILKEIEENPVTTQADLASKLRVATGTVNWHLKRLAAKGLIKMERIGHWQWRYILTPKGMAERARLVKAYIQRSMRLYREIRKEARKLLAEPQRAGAEEVRIEGDGDLVDVCRLTCLEQGIEVVSEDSDLVPVLKVEDMELELEWPEGTGGRKRDDTVKQEVLDEVIRRIVEVAQPEKIILFGSASRGEMGPNSDLDLLVVKSGVHRRQLAQAIYMNLIGVGQAVDVIVVTPEDIERCRNTIGLIIEPALREGRTVYVA